MSRGICEINFFADARYEEAKQIEEALRNTPYEVKEDGENMRICVNKRD